MADYLGPDVVTHSEGALERCESVTPETPDDKSNLSTPCSAEATELFSAGAELTLSTRSELLHSGLPVNAVILIMPGLE